MSVAQGGGYSTQFKLWVLSQVKEDPTYTSRHELSREDERIIEGGEYRFRTPSGVDVRVFFFLPTNEGTMMVF